MSGKNKFNLAEYSDETKEKEPIKEEIKETKPAIEEPKQKKEEKTETVEGPKTEEIKAESEDKSKLPPVRTSVAIEADLVDALTAGAGKKYKGNKSAYINALIRADYEANKEAYDELLKLLS